MLDLSRLDMIALAWFAIAWLGYSFLIDRAPHGAGSLNAHMIGYRHRWMRAMLTRDNRIVDMQVNMQLQQGAGFFASTSFIAIGACVTLLGATEKALDVIQATSLIEKPSRVLWEVKTIGLALFFVYAFFKFGWAYRLFNYGAIMIGAAPKYEGDVTPEMEKLADRAARLNAIAAGHFNKGQRAFFFSLGYLGWFVSPWLFMAGTAAVLFVLYRRQFWSDSFRALQ
ncbi:MAG: hypothetical protein BGP06_00825 [Rhizobiales bacterium 65-9]|nr:DUF599 family protein [Hyphomicrobiales bacterium]OJY37410.1 MAG: hypothetical protein BGP06_00825 [Rhizobiales bacterium 65-9]